MSTTAPSLATALTDILNSVVTIIDEIANTISANAAIIADVLIIGGLVFGVLQVYKRVGPAVSSFFRGLF